MRIPFDIKYKPQIESGKYKVETEEGSPARIICWDSPINKERPIIAIVFDNQIEQYKADGHYDNDYETCNYDLFIVTPEEELTPFEKELVDILKCLSGRPSEQTYEDYAKEQTAELLAIAREQFIKDGYVIEKKAFHDAVEKVDPEVMKDVSENVDVSNFIAKLGERYPEVSFAKLTRIAKAAYDYGKAEALRTRATELTKNLDKSGLDKDSIPYHLIEFMCNLYTCRNWKEIEATAEAYATRLKAAALKDLPRWKPAARAYDGDRLPRIDWSLNRLVARFEEGIFYLDIRELYKLPGFKE